MRLYDALRAQQDVVRNATAQREYTAALGHLAQLRPAVDTFFEQVMVMDENPAIRNNRLALLGAAEATLWRHRGPVETARLKSRCSGCAR